MNIELVYLCAEYAQQTENPMVYMNKVLQNWREKGIDTLSAARAEHDARSAQRDTVASPWSGKKELQGLAYTQRTYDPDELNALVDDLSDIS